MEENTKLELEGKKEEKFPFDFQTIYTTLILNWKWFILSLIACLGLAAVYLRYTVPNPRNDNLGNNIQLQWS